MDEKTVVADPNAKAPVAPAAEAKQDTVAKPVAEATIGKVLAEDSAPRVVPEATFLETKNALKEARKTIKQLQSKNVDLPADIQTEIDRLSETSGNDKQFLTDYAKLAVKASKHGVDMSDADADTEDTPADPKPTSSKKGEDDRITKAFETAFTQTMAEMPDAYGAVVDKDELKALSLLPKNHNKTFKQLIEEQYAHKISGKRTFETATPRADRSGTETLDVKRAQADPAYFKEVMADPTLRAEYNKGITDRLGQFL